MHSAAGFGGPWIENTFISTFETLYNKKNQTCVHKIFGTYILIFVPWVDWWLATTRYYLHKLISALMSVLRPNVPYHGFAE